MAILPFILSLAVFPLVSAQPWYAVFWNTTTKAFLNATFEQQVPITPNDLSYNHLECDHTTIAFNPPQNLITSYTNLLTIQQSARILGYAHDEHGQAILLHYQNTTGGPALIPTQNSFPHTTISHQNVAPYTAVYSNDLWSRVNSSGYVNITFGADGFPEAIAFAAGNTPINNTLQFPLPGIILGANNYTATVVNVTIVDPNQYLLTGTFCVNSNWSSLIPNVCSNFIPTPTPTTPAPNTTNTTTAPTTPTPTNTTIAPNTTASPNTTALPTSTPTNPGNATSAPSTGMRVEFNGITMIIGAIIMLAFF